MCCKVALVECLNIMPAVNLFQFCMYNLPLKNTYDNRCFFYYIFKNFILYYKSSSTYSFLMIVYFEAYFFTKARINKIKDITNGIDIIAT